MSNKACNFVGKKEHCALWDNMVDRGPATGNRQPNVVHHNNDYSDGVL